MDKRMRWPWQAVKMEAGHWTYREYDIRRSVSGKWGLMRGRRFCRWFETLRDAKRYVDVMNYFGPFKYELKGRKPATKKHGQKH